MENVARSNLLKAEKLLSGAETNLSAQNFDSAAVLAAISAIKAKDAIAIFLSGTSKKGRSHLDAVAELKRLPGVPADVVKAFRNLVSRKTDAQYGTDLISKTRAQSDIDHARLIVEFGKHLMGSFR